MSSTWVTRIGEGLVIGITATVAFWVFDSMNDARLELGKARETLNLQVEVNQALLDQYDGMEARLDRFSSRLKAVEEVGSGVNLDSLDENGPTVGSVPSEVSPASSVNETSYESTIEWSEPRGTFTEVPPPPRSMIQQRIDQQKKITQ